MSRTLAKSFRSYCREHSLSIREAAKLLDISPGYLSLYFSGAGDISAASVAALEARISDLMIRDDDDFYRLWRPILDMLGTVPWYVRHRLVRELSKQIRTEK